MNYVDLSAVYRVGRNPNVMHGATAFTAKELIEYLGGVEGLLRLHHNAGALMDIARYLTMMNPDAGELAGVIAQDAATIRRVILRLRWQQKLGFLGFSTCPLQIHKLARSYVGVSRNSLTLCGSLADEVFPLLQEVTNVQARMMRNSVGISSMSDK